MGKRVFEISDEDIEVTRKRRYAFIKGLWDLLVDKGLIDPKRFMLCSPLVDEIVEHYLEDWMILKARYRIEKEIQLHKVAGLTTAAILRYRPIIPIANELNGKREIYVNEFFAAMHGLGICGDHSLDVCEVLAQEDWFGYWFDDFLFLLHRRNYTAEALNFIYETFSMFRFPKNII
jgi:hypothetical protein